MRGPSTQGKEPEQRDPTHLVCSPVAGVIERVPDAASVAQELPHAKPVRRVRQWDERHADLGDGAARGAVRHGSAGHPQRQPYG